MTIVTEGLRNIEAEQRHAELEARPSSEKTVRERLYNRMDGKGDFYTEGAVLEPKESKIFASVLLESQALGIENGDDPDFSSDTEIKQEAKRYREAIKIIDSLPNNQDPYLAIQEYATHLQVQLDAMGSQGLSAGNRLQAAALGRKIDAAWQAVGALGSVDYQFNESLRDKIKKPDAIDTEFIVNKEIRFFNELAKSNAVKHASEQEEAKYNPDSQAHVDDGSVEVAHQGDSYTPERTEKQKHLEQFLSAAKGSTRIHTDMPANGEVSFKDGTAKPRSGFQSFGDGLAEYSQGESTDKFLVDKEYSEAVIFSPNVQTIYKTVTETIESGGRFSRKTEQVSRKVADGQEPIMVTNMNTGASEPGVKVAYQFISNGYNYDGPRYDTQGGRPGNVLVVETIVPQSIADDLRRIVSENPVAARDVARMLVLQNGISESNWKGLVKPPYENLSADWNIAITDAEQVDYNGVTRVKPVSRAVLQAL